MLRSLLQCSLKVDFQGFHVTSDYGLILVRELDERLGFGELIVQHLTDSRRGENTQFPFADLLRQSVYSPPTGYEDLNDVPRRSKDPTFRLIGWEKARDRGAALTSPLPSFETKMLAEEENIAGWPALYRALIGRAEAMDSGYRTILDMDSTEIPTCREQKQSALASKPVGCILLWLGTPKWTSWITRCRGEMTMKRRDLIKVLCGGICASGPAKLLGVSSAWAVSVLACDGRAEGLLPTRDGVSSEDETPFSATTPLSGVEPKPSDGRQHSFALGTEDFLLDGKPFQIRCGEMHPVRIPREHWRQRIQLAKAMGLNTVSFCVFWNAHEEEEGEFDFKSGELDIGEYLQIAQEEGLWVFLRPGPYVCSEWDLGGLPWWLLRTPDIKLRSSDPRFTQPVERYFHQLAKVVRPHTVENGGSILLVQIENEYGSYPRRDHDYLVWLRDLWVKEGIKGPFITADGAAEHYLQGVTIPGVAIGLDPGVNDAQFELARKMNPGVPVMSTETYPGWLRHWGEGWWAPRDVSGLLKYYMDTRRSFSLYMFHGGTNFGFHAGANGNNHDLTSYDFAAPVNEQGRPTPAYYAYRQQLASYLPAGQSLPEVPAPIPTMEIPSIRLERWSGLWERLPKPVFSEQPQCFEALGQNQGFVLYRTRIPAGVWGKLSTPLHGDPIIYVEGAPTQNLDIPARGQEATLEILVQAMGHINFLIEMDGDRKGLLGTVKVGGTVLKNWEMFCFPLTSDWVTSLPKTTPAPGRIGGIFKGEFILDTVADTYLDMSNYKKGVLWVNGRNLGYHWSARGPQYRLYCPGPWLKKGVNTIVVLDTELTEPQPVAGTRTDH